MLEVVKSLFYIILYKTYKTSPQISVNKQCYESDIHSAALIIKKIILITLMFQCVQKKGIYISHVHIKTSFLIAVLIIS